MSRRPQSGIKTSEQEQEDVRAHVAIQSELKRLQTDVDATAQNLRRMEAEGKERKVKIENEIASLEKALGAKKLAVSKQMQDLEEDSSIIKHQRESLAEENSALVETNKTLRTEKEDLLAKHREILAETAIAQQSYEEVELARNAAIDDSARITSDNLRLSERTASLVQKASETEAKVYALERKRVEHDAFITSSTTVRAQLQEQLDTTRQAVDALQEEETDLKTRVAALSKEEVAFNERMAAKEAQIDEKARSLALLDKSVDVKIEKLKRQDDKASVDKLGADKGL